VEDAQMFGDRLHLRIRSGAAEEVGARIQTGAIPAGLAVERIRSIRPGLEDVFIALLEDGG
jgi:hypothetical protein